MNREDAPPEQFKATQIVFSELSELLADYQGAVVVGGNVPALLISQVDVPHIGTLDIDVLLDPERLSGDGELTLHERLERLLFQQGTKRPFRYTRTVEVAGHSHGVLLEFLGGGEVPPGGLLRIPREDVYVSVIAGMEVALDRPVRARIGQTPFNRSP
ncbi:hypothetical protein BH11ARM2_BH11ARM2_10950 [soil metagenome]